MILSLDPLLPPRSDGQKAFCGLKRRQRNSVSSGFFRGIAMSELSVCGRVSVETRHIVQLER